MPDPAPTPPPRNVGASHPSAPPRDRPFRRRMVTIPIVFLSFWLVTALLPLLVAIASTIDVVRAIGFRRPWVSLRLTLFLWCYLLAQVVGISTLFSAWVASGFGVVRTRLLSWTYAIQAAWAGFLFEAVRVLFSLRFDVEGGEVAARGPILVFVRHASIADTLLPARFVTRRHGVRLRFVLKRELLVDPCLDVAGNWIPNHFVARGSKESAAEVEAVRELTRNLGPSEGVLIYPEGTRFTKQKREALVRRLTPAGGAPLALASRLTHVLPPRHGGPLALLDGHTEADVVILAHRGLEGFATIGDVWRGVLVGRTIRLRMWRIPKNEIPQSKEERTAWLDEQWTKLDAWVGEEKS